MNHYFDSSKYKIENGEKWQEVSLSEKMKKFILLVIMVLIFMFALSSIEQVKASENDQYTITYKTYENYDPLMNIPLDVHETIIEVSLGGAHTLAITSKGRVFSWGWNLYGQLGTGTTINSNKPMDITAQFGLGNGETIIQVSCGTYHSSALTSEGRVFTWGHNGDGQLGLSGNEFFTPTEITSRFGLVIDETIIKIDMSGQHSSAITSEGRVFMWGYNYHGQLGDGTKNIRNVPTEITSRFGLGIGETITQVALGTFHSSALSSEGRIFMWGYNNLGQLGNNSTTERTVPTEITIRFGLGIGETITQVALGRYHSSALTTDGRIFIWGSNSNGQLGDGLPYTRYMPLEITSQFEIDLDEKLTKVSLGDYHTSVLTSEGKIFIWGWNLYGQLGDGTKSSRYTPIEITSQFEFGVDESIAKISMGGSYSSTITSEGRVLMWGSNIYGELGNVTNISYSTPQVLPFINAYSSETKTHDYNETLVEYNLMRNSYTFDGWYTDESLVTSYIFTTMPAQNITLYANFTILLYALEYVDYDGTILQTDDYMYQDDLSLVTAPTSPTRVGYTFNGWSGIVPETMGTESVTITATYTINSYDVEYVDYDGTVLQTNDYKYQDDLSIVTAPTSPTRVGYTFNGWSGIVPETMGTESITVTATYTINQYTATFKDHDGTVMHTSTVDYLTHAEAPENPTRLEYTFSGWDVSFDPMTHDMDVTATYTINQYTATFKDHDGTVIVTSTVDYLTSAVAPANPTKTGYTFSGWDVSFDSMTQDRDVTATYTINQYTATFKDHNGTVMDTSTVDYLANAIVPADPSRTGYTFSGWDISFDSMTHDMDVTATYTINQYTISFNTFGGTDMESIILNYGTAITYLENPTKEGFIFNGWSQALPETIPAENMTLNTRWLKETYENIEIETQVEGLLKAIDQTVIEGRDTEVIIQIIMKKLEEMNIEKESIISEMVSNDLNIRNQGMIYLDISVIIKELGEEDVQVNQLTQMISITLHIPVEHQGYKNYQIIRVHDGNTELLESIYNEETQTLAFETDRFSTYVIVYDASRGSGLWWLLTLILIPIGYFIYQNRDVIRTKTVDIRNHLKKKISSTKSS